MKFKMIHLILPVAVFSCMATAHANDIRSVIAVNDRTIAVSYTHLTLPTICSV